MDKLFAFLKKNTYKRVRFRITKTQHLLIKAKINGIQGNFILDTGASNSCVDFEKVDKFLLKAEHSDQKAAGAGATGMLTQTSSGNSLALGRWKDYDFDLVVFDLSHVNQALKEYKQKPIDGIIGADVLMKSKAIIDYYHNCMYLAEGCEL